MEESKYRKCEYSTCLDILCHHRYRGYSKLCSWSSIILLCCLTSRYSSGCPGENDTDLLVHLYSCIVLSELGWDVDDSIFQVVFTFMAIRQRNTIQIIGLVIFNACFVAYSAVQVRSRPAPHPTLSLKLHLSCFAVFVLILDSWNSRFSKGNRLHRHKHNSLQTRIKNETHPNRNPLHHRHRANRIHLPRLPHLQRLWLARLQTSRRRPKNPPLLFLLRNLRLSP